jgi:hypothetical protein
MGTIFNETDEFWWVWNHDQGIVGAQLPVPPRSNGSFACDDVFGWCKTTSEIETRATEFRTDTGGGILNSTIRFYMFQDFDTAEIDWVPFPPGNFPNRIRTGFQRVECLGVRILPSRTPVAFRIA